MTSHKPSLDDNLRRFSEELNSARTVRDIEQILRTHTEWIERLSGRGRETLTEVVHDRITAIADEQ